MPSTGSRPADDSVAARADATIEQWMHQERSDKREGT